MSDSNSHEETDLEKSLKQDQTTAADIEGQDALERETMEALSEAESASIEMSVE